MSQPALRLLCASLLVCLVTASIAVADDDCPSPTPLAFTSVDVTPAVLSPPNHKMVLVTFDYTTTGGCGTPDCAITSVTSNEPEGNDAPDWEIVDANHVLLRAERTGGGSGRTYTITITCTSGSSIATQQVTVIVPKNEKGSGF